jgi:hypothetical protein
MVSLDSSSCFAFDFDYSSSGGVSSDPDVYPTVQTVFAYSCIEPHGDTAFSIMVRTRIETFRFDVGRYPLEVMSNCRIEETMVLLSHKVLMEARKRGIIEARNLLHDWLVILYAKYNKCFSRNKSQSSATLDFSFSKAQARIKPFLKKLSPFSSLN